MKNQKILIIGGGVIGLGIEPKAENQPYGEQGPYPAGTRARWDWKLRIP